MAEQRFYFIRHGETDWNVEKRNQGSIDIALNDKGRQQAHDIVASLKNLPITRIVSSHLQRAHETALIINETLQKPLVVDPQLAERNFGICEGKTPDEMAVLKRLQPELFTPYEGLEPWACKPQGEEVEVFANRIFDAIERNIAAYPNDTLLFVSHGGMYRVLQYLITRKYDAPHNATPFFVTLKNRSQATLQAVF